MAAAVANGAPVPLLAKGHPVDWWFVFKMNAAVFPACGGAVGSCPFGGTVQPYKTFGQQYVYASSESQFLQDRVKDCVGTTDSDPVGASFNEVYNGNYHYVLWNDQFYDDPLPIRGAPWGHSKGMLAWDDAGQGFVMQVSTPSWPGAGNVKSPRLTDGNTLGCIKDNDVKVSQHFLALRLTKDDLILVLQGMKNSSVVTNPTSSQLVSNGGPSDVQALVNGLGKLSDSEALVQGTLSSGFRFISKPSSMNVPPWQMVSATLGGIGLRAATWWANPEIPSTTTDSTITCWDESLGTPGPVEIATAGTWEGRVFSLAGGLGANFNHAKIGVSTTRTQPYVIFGDENQQGTLVKSAAGKCDSSQNGRGGMFYAISSPQLNGSIGNLIAGDTASSGN
ncbi:Deoxyribonuclease II [Terriglobus roseus]|uniref:Deoxyribonuclease II n=1 Tax=Terriglobus roseus TaxID=392734 RepID=A0A1H4IW73_9BACT|nr:Deoxyribonuclease II [Terriglobus roseus]